MIKFGVDFRFIVILFFVLFVFSVRAQTSKTIQDYKGFLPLEEVDFSKRIVTKSKDGIFKVKDFYENGKPAFIAETKILYANETRATGGEMHFYSNGNVKKAKRMEGEDIIVQEYFNNGELYKEYTYTLRNTQKIVKTIKEPTGNILVLEGNGISKELDKINEIYFIESGSYENGIKLGEWKGYTEENKLLFVESYNKNGLTLGISYNDDETINNYVNEKGEVPFKGGAKALRNFLISTVEMPREAMRQNISGRASMRFIVAKDGEIKNIECINDTPEVLRKEAFRVIEKSKGKWLPIRKKGFPVEEYFMLPIVFNISGM